MLEPRPALMSLLACCHSATSPVIPCPVLPSALPPHLPSLQHQHVYIQPRHALLYTTPQHRRTHSLPTVSSFFSYTITTITTTTITATNNNTSHHNYNTTLSKIRLAVLFYATTTNFYSTPAQVKAMPILHSYYQQQTTTTNYYSQYKQPPIYTTTPYNTHNNNNNNIKVQHRNIYNIISPLFLSHAPAVTMKL